MPSIVLKGDVVHTLSSAKRIKITTLFSTPVMADPSFGAAGTHDSGTAHALWAAER